MVRGRSRSECGPRFPIEWKRRDRRGRAYRAGDHPSSNCVVTNILAMRQRGAVGARHDREGQLEKQQIRDSSKWWDGVFGPYDTHAQVTRTIEDPDIFVGRMVCVLTCDGPGLSKAPFLASKNVHFPDAEEIEAREYYIENFVWGGMPPYGTHYELLQDGAPVELVTTGDWDYPWRATIRMGTASSRVALVRAGRR